MIIYKYVIPASIGRHTLNLPINSFILSVQNQHEEMCMWAIIDPQETCKEERTFRIIPTGQQEFNPKYLGNFLGTVQMSGSYLVFHVFEELSRI